MKSISDLEICELCDKTCASHYESNLKTCDDFSESEAIIRVKALIKDRIKELENKIVDRFMVGQLRCIPDWASGDDTSYPAVPNMEILKQMQKDLWSNYELKFDEFLLIAELQSILGVGD